jgi:hypothetical protein
MSHTILCIAYASCLLGRNNQPIDESLDELGRLIALPHVRFGDVKVLISTRTPTTQSFLH